MVMVTIDIPREVNKEIEHFKVEQELKDKRDAIILLLKQCMLKESRKDGHKGVLNEFQSLFRQANKTKMHNLTPKDLDAMDSDIYG